MENPTSFNEFYHQLRVRKVPFLAIFAFTIFVTYGVLYAIDFIPEPGVNDTASSTAAVATSTTAQTKDAVGTVHTAELAPAAPVAAEPVKIVFDTLGKSVKVLNPTSDKEADLDKALLSGAVHHPDSADFTKPGNIFILGHSSYLPNVINKNFQSFNGIQKLSWGDTIRVLSTDTEYIYRVEKVFEAKASEVTVPSTPGEARLTLSTCNVFGAKEDRYVVEAVQISHHAL